MEGLQLAFVATCMLLCVNFGCLQVVEGMVVAGKARAEATGRGLEVTGSTAKPVEGQEIDWYVGSAGAFHVRGAIDSSVRVIDNDDAAAAMIRSGW